MKKILTGILLTGFLTGCSCLAMNQNVFAKTADTTVYSEAASHQAAEKVITVDAKSGTDIADELDDALKEARDTATDVAPVTVKVSAGNYKLGHSLHIFSNTTLDLSAGVTLRYTGDTGNLLMSGTSGSYKGYDNYNKSKASAGYKGTTNIKIIGGSWIGNNKNKSSLIRIAHAANVTMQKMTLSGGGCAHQAEVAAISGFYVKKCTFKDYGKTESSGSKDKQEALQLDIPCSKEIYKGVYEDGTVMKNVEITGCLFQNVPRGIGSHSLLHGAYHENIKINGNRFKNLLEEAVIGVNYYNCEINDNVIENCGAGIMVQFFKATPVSMYTTTFDGTKAYHGSIRHDAATTISGNTMSIRYTKTCDETVGIKVYGRKVDKAETVRDKKKIAAGDYYISGVTIADNQITTAGYGIHLMDVKNSTIRKNQIVGKNYSSSDPRKGKYDGIFADTASKNLSISANGIKKVARCGIFGQNSTNFRYVWKNSISGCGDRGIHLYNSSSCGKISENKISNCKGNGIFLNKKSTASEVRNNTIDTLSGSGAKGVALFDRSKVTSDIAANKISKTADAGISMSTKCIVNGDIADNTISGAGSHGVFIFKTSTVSGYIRNNAISGSKQNAVHISDANAKIEENVISNAKNGVYVTTSGKVKIYSNTYKSGVKNKIYIFGKTKNLVSKKPVIKKFSSSKTKMNLKWTKLSNANGYEIQYSLNTDFKSVKRADSTKVSISLKKPKKGKIYYARIAAYQKIKGVKVYSGYSRSVRLK